MFRSGFFLTLALLIAYKALFLWIGAISAYILFQRSRWDELFSFIGGATLITAVVGIILFLRGSLVSFIQVGLLFDVDRVGQSSEYFYLDHPTSPWIYWLLTVGVVILLAIVGVIHFRIRFYSYLAKIRSLELILFVFTISSLVTLAFKWTWVRLEDFLLLALPISFYATKVFDFSLTRRLQWILSVLILAIPLYQILAFFPVLGSRSAPISEDPFRVGRAYAYQVAFEPILNQWAGKNVNDVWIMDHLPEVYPLLDAYPRLPYVDFRIAYYKIPCFNEDENYFKFSSQAGLGEVFEELKAHPPQYIIDPEDRFSRLITKFPFLSNLYVRESVDEHTIYRRKD